MIHFMQEVDIVHCVNQVLGTSDTTLGNIWCYVIIFRDEEHIYIRFNKKRFHLFILVSKMSLVILEM